MYTGAAGKVTYATPVRISGFRKTTAGTPRLEGSIRLRTEHGTESFRHLDQGNITIDGDAFMCVEGTVACGWMLQGSTGTYMFRSVWPSASVQKKVTNASQLAA
jgi:hypothetical protein